MTETSNSAGVSSIQEIQKGWFTETETLWPGQKFSLALESFSEKSILYNQHSGIQSILVFKSAQYGNVLVLDGVIQLTERDEFAYHEMMVHIPLNAHSNPERVLIVGGGDGGILREVCKHDTVKEIVMVEIDTMVVEVSLKYLSTALEDCFQDARLKIVSADAADFLASHEPDYFDVIIGDTSDPVGPAESLFQPTFYESMHAALRAADGIVCMQAECFWIHLDLISDVHACCCDIFDSAEYATTMVPTYPCGQIGFILARRRQQEYNGNTKQQQQGRRREESVTTCSYPVREPAFVKDLKWYSPQVHEAAFVLPPFVKRQLGYELPTRPRVAWSQSNGGDSFWSNDAAGISNDDTDGEERTKCFLDGFLQFCRSVFMLGPAGGDNDNSFEEVQSEDDRDEDD